MSDCGEAKWKSRGSPLFGKLWSFEDLQSLPTATPEVRPARPANWPRDTEVEPGAWVFWLPTNWIQGVRTQEESGKKLTCFMNPEGKRFWHKTAVEKHLGYKLGDRHPREGRVRYVTDDDAVPCWPKDADGWLPQDFKIAYRQLPTGLHRIFIPPDQAGGFLYHRETVLEYLKTKDKRLLTPSGQCSILDLENLEALPAFPSSTADLPRSLTVYGTKCSLDGIYNVVPNAGEWRHEQNDGSTSFVKLNHDGTWVLGHSKSASHAYELKGGQWHTHRRICSKSPLVAVMRPCSHLVVKEMPGIYLNCTQVLDTMPSWLHGFQYPPTEQNVLDENIKDDQYKFMPGRDCILAPNDCVLDIGAHMGVSAAIAAQTAQKVVAVEPLHRTFDLLSANMARLALTDRVECLEIAIAEEGVEVLPMYLHCGKAGEDRLFFCSSSKQRKHHAQPEYSAAQSLQTLVDAYSPTVLKIDGEGCERHLVGLSNMDSIRVICGEWDWTHNKHKSSWLKVKKHLESKNFVAARIVGWPSEFQKGVAVFHGLAAKNTGMRFRFQRNIRKRPAALAGANTSGKSMRIEAPI